MTYFLQLTTNGIMLGAVYGMIALGFVLIFKASGVLNVAQGEMVMFGGFVVYALCGQLGLPVPVALILALPVCFLIGYFLIEHVFIRPLIGQSLLAVVMMTIAIGAILKGVTQLIWTTSLYRYPQYLPTEPLRIGAIRFSPDYLLAFIISLILVGVCLAYFRYAKAGLAMRSIADDQQMAQAMGVSVNRIFGVTWGIAFMVAAVGGFCLGTIRDVGFSLSAAGLAVFPVVILGGLDSILGAIVGGLIIGVLQNLAGGYLSGILPAVKDTFPFIILLIILMFKPFGLWGLKRIERI